MVHPRAQQRDLADAFAYCEHLAKSHYENFTVVSWFLPKSIRASMYAVYAFCRHTDDLGDEAAGDRLALLGAWETDLWRCYGGEPEHLILLALQATIRLHDIPAEPFLKLIEANRMDQRISRYETYDDLLRYCDHSANSVGHMVLHVFGYADVKRHTLSDATCTALQLANFLQDIRHDFANGRIYLPREDLYRFGYTEQLMERDEYNAAFRDLVAFEVARARALFLQGAPLTDLVGPRLRLDLRLFTQGGMAVLDAIEARNYDVLSRRPVVSKAVKARLFLAGIGDLAAQKAFGRRVHG